MLEEGEEKQKSQSRILKKTPRVDNNKLHTFTVKT